MFQNSIVCILIFILSLLLALPAGAYMNKVYKGRNNFLDFLKPFENFIFKICRIDPLKDMNWKQYLIAMAVINAVWLVFGFVILIFQGNLFLNPAGNPSMEWSLAFNSAISFLTSTNLQHYSGESGATYLSQMGVFRFLQFVSAATSLSVGVAVVRGLWIAGLLIDKIYTPRSAGTLKIQSITFGVFLFCVIIILNVLSLFPSLMLGPASDHFLLK
jgi:K+-transporting ATPase ATPase A chain